MDYALKIFMNLNEDFGFTLHTAKCRRALAPKIIDADYADDNHTGR